MSDLDEEEIFGALLQSMGVSQFDKMVPVALSEYAHRFAAELLSDAKEFSLHARKQEIDAEDILLAVKMNSHRITGLDASESAAQALQSRINSKNLMEMTDRDSVLNRYPPDMLMQRTHTFAPGSEAYPETDATTEANGDAAMIADGDNSGATGADTVGTGAANTSAAYAYQKGSRVVGFKQNSLKSGGSKLKEVPGFS